MQKSLYGFDGPLAIPAPSPGRQRLARLLRQASRLLARLARQLMWHPPSQRIQRALELEFHAEAGAPEGALYVDGKLVGYLPGVKRL
jgi:hypothetical protein